MTRLGFGMISFTLPLFALSIGMNVLDIGLLGSIRGVSVIAVKPVMGRLAVRFGTRNIFLVAVAGRVASSLLFLAAGTPWQLFAIRSLHGASVAARDPTAATLLAADAPRGALARSFAWYTTARDVGGALGFAVAGFALTLSNRNYRLPFVIAALTSAVALALSARLLPKAQRDGFSLPPASRAREGGPAAPNVGPAPPRPRSTRRLRVPSGPTLRLSAFGSLVGATAQMLYGLFPVLAVHYAHLTEAQTGGILTLSAAVLLVGGPAFGWLSDRVSRHLVLMVRAFSNAVSSLLYLVAPTLGGIAAARMLDDAGKAAFRPTWAALMTGDQRQLRSPAAIADLDAAYSLGEVTGPLLAGWLWQSFGLAPMLLTRAGLALVTELFGWLVVYEPRPRQSRPLDVLAEGDRAAS